MGLAERRHQTEGRIKELRAGLKSAEALTKGKACVYATGSFGRGEAGTHSDLDLFILGKSDQRGESLLKRLDEICVKADLIEITRQLGVPEFSGDGRYLVHYSVSELTKTLGTPHDDVTNTFTARLLLLLESCPLLENDVYADVTEEVIAAYWRDYEDHKSDFMPAFLSNDILRLWRTFCVNYEAGTERVPEYEKVKGKIKNYKLKHSRLLTCYSALLYLLALHGMQDTVSPSNAIEMIKLTPTQRLEWLIGQSHLSRAHSIIGDILAQYDVFLDTTNVEEHELVDRFLDKTASRDYMNAAYKFGDFIFEALSSIGQGNRYYRLLVV
jgi:hypothetical protein